MADNFLYIPLINPVKFYDPDRAVTDKYFTPHFDQFPFEERLYDWQQPEEYTQIWQVDDIINLQFESSFDPIIVELIDQYGVATITLPALVGLPHKLFANTFSYEVAMSLATVTTGCYRIKITAGSGGGQKIFWSKWMYISEEPIRNSICIEYWHTRFREDVMFETGIKFQYRLFGHLGFMTPGVQNEQYRDQRYNPTILSSKSFRQYKAIFGDEFGLPDDEIDLLNRIWGCNNVLIDNKSFCAADGSKFEFEEIENGLYPKRGVRLNIEEGVNRNSSLFTVETDVTKKLNYAIAVSKKVWGDTSNQGSSNTVPLVQVE